MRRIFLVIWAAAFLAAGTAALPLTAQAAVSNWQQGASLVPMSQGDFGSESFRQSLRNLAATGASHVSLIVPLYQSNRTSADLQSGWNTPADAALESAINYAHSIGLAVMLTVHVETFDGAWRAEIDAADRATWYARYGDYLVKYGRMAQRLGVEDYVLGAEMSKMTAARFDAQNTANWNNLISRVRGVYSGSISYSAQRQGYLSEVTDIGFWGQMNYIGLSGYYDLDAPVGASVDQLKAEWDRINNSDIRPVYERYNKPIVFTEIGYRSYAGSYQRPWDYNTSGPYDPTAQSNAYEAMLSYWDRHDYIRGVHLWDWSTNPNAGGQGDTGFTPQNKPAEAIMTKWYSADGQPAAAPEPQPTLEPQPAPEPGPTRQAQPEPEPAPSVAVLSNWWPVDEATVQGVQPFKARIENRDLSTYKLFWRVDGGQLSPMYDAHDGGLPHKLAWIDLSGWSWNAANRYKITFVAQDGSGEMLAEKTITINVAR